MHISDFDYDLPAELIAREPIRPRDASRMMVVRAQTGDLIDTDFRKLPEFLDASDVLVINDTRVIRARIHGTLLRRSGASREIEVLFAAPISSDSWEVMCRPGKSVRKGDRVVLGTLEGVFGDSREHGLRELRLTSSTNLYEFLEQHGRVPLPPYIDRPVRLEDSFEYQTVFANAPGAVAAPTAGLHFTPATLDAVKSRGIEILKITLHVGVGTFMPVRTDDPRQHALKPERFEVSAAVADRLNAARSAGRRIVAVGTTTTRTLEYVLSKHERFVACSGEADIFILPGHKFLAVQAMLTNFHLPRSTLLMLVTAFASRPVIMKAYAHAIEKRYRFYSYGDCMLLVQ